MRVPLRQDYMANYTWEVEKGIYYIKLELILYHLFLLEFVEVLNYI